MDAVTAAPLDQESPGSSPGGATRLPRCGSRFFFGGGAMAGGSGTSAWQDEQPYRSYRSWPLRSPSP